MAQQVQLHLVQVCITSAGLVGIGTVSPSYNLDVVGEIRALQTSNSGISQLMADASNTTGYRAALATFGNTAVGNLLGIGRAANSFLYKIGGTLVVGTENAFPLIFSTSDTERLRITSGGNVLIGTTTDSNQKLTVNGSYVRIHSLSTDNTNAGVFYQVKSGASTVGQSSQLVDNAGNYIITTGTSSEAERLRITSGGNVLIGTTDDGGKLVSYSTTAANQIKAAGTAPAITFSNTVLSPTYGGVLGTCTSAGQFLSGTAAGDMVLANQFSGYRVYVASYSGGVYLTSGATSWTANSDIRLKNINSHIENAVEKLSTLQTINFSYKDDKTNKQNLGLIAQEVEKIFPELIDKNGDGMLGVRYTELVPVLIKAIQEQQKEINELKLKIK
jgi:hypothetical protein